MEVGYKDLNICWNLIPLLIQNYLYRGWTIVLLVIISLYHLTFLGYIPMPFN